MPLNNLITVRKGTEAEWYASAAVLSAGEPGFDTTNGLLKIGDGTSTWENLLNTAVFSDVAIINASSGSTPFSVEGTNGSLFSVVDNLDGTLMSVNNNAGLPVFEVFSDDSIVGGRFGQNDFVISSGGNVGIGTAAPLAQLHVFNQTPSSSISEVARFGTSGTYDGNFRFLVGSTSDRGGELRYYEGNTEYSRVNFDVNRIDFITRGAYPINFLTNNNGSEGNNLRMTITSDGNVGIGTDTPSYKLNVNTSTDSSNGLQIVNNSAGTSARSLLSLNNGTYGAEISVGGAGFTNNGFYRQNRLLISGPFITDYVTSQHVFHIGGGGTGQSVSGSTQVGVWDINALAVSNELRPTGGIAGGTLVGSSLSLKSTTAVGTTDHIKLLVGNNGATEAVRVINNGNVGIGTTTPEYTLQVNGSFGATTKSFRIDHPSRPNYTLEYGSLESPYHGVRLTGRGSVIKGIGTISLPAYLKDLIHDDETINIQITNFKHGKTIYVDEINLNSDTFTVKADRAKTLGELQFFWVLTGVRKDVDKLEVEKEKI